MDLEIEDRMSKDKLNVEISEDEFRAYVYLQKSGVINMNNFSVITNCTGLTNEQCFFIMGNYKKLQRKYPNNKQGD